MNNTCEWWLSTFFLMWNVDTIDTAISISTWFTLLLCISCADNIVIFAIQFFFILSLSLCLGFIVDFISVPVTSAFTSATSLIIIGSQLKNLLGLEYSAKEFMTSIYMLIERIDQSVYWDAILAVGCCLFLLILRVRTNGFLFVWSKLILI